MTHEAKFRTVFPAKKGDKRRQKRYKEAYEVPCVRFNALPEAFRRYSEKKVTC